VSRPLVVVVLAAGKGTRMRSALPKVLHPLAGRPMLGHVLAAAEALEPTRIVVVVGPDMPEVAEAAAPHAVAIQAEQRGTADAVAAARSLAEPALGEDGELLVLYGDGPLITPETLQRMRAARAGAGAPAFVWLGFRPPDPTGYGRLLRDGSDDLTAIVEEKDATPDQRRVDLCWGGLMLGEGAALFRLLPRIDDDNAKREFYLTALVALGRGEGLRAGVVECDAEEVRGVNSRVELAEAEAILQRRLRRAAMEAGVGMAAPETVFLSWDTQLAPDVTLEPHVVFGPGVRVERGARILAFSHLEGALVGEGARIGPFARLRPGTRIGAGAHVGNFVEMKATDFGAGAKANHLSYLGDSAVGPGSNIGAGTITVNYDGFVKSRTTIGAGVFVGSNSSLVAPLTLGEGAVVAAGSTIVEDVPADGLAIARAPQTLREGAAARRRERKRKTRKESKT